ncbi:MAG: MFS transporter [Promethearchaeota archaeon]
MENKKISRKKRSKRYFIFMILVLMCVEILDTYTTNFPNIIPSRIIAEFLSEYPSNVANSLYALCVAIASIGMYVVFFNQLMADKFGRKILLAFTVFGMAFTSLLLLFSTNIIQYTIYLLLLYMFFSSDIWVIYINEESPPDKRAIWTDVILMGGVTGSILLPVFRSIYISETVSNWRGMTYFPIFLGIPLSITILLAFKETLKYEEIKELKQKGKIGEEKVNILSENLKIIFSSKRKKEIASVLIMTFLVGMNYIFVSLGESYISSNPNLNQNDINIIVLVMSLSVVLGYLITGILADKYGRKPLFYGYSILFPISIVLVMAGSFLSQGALLIVCIGAGLANVSYWGLGVVIRLVIIELTPTNVRGTSSGLKGLFNAAGITTGLLLSSVITLYLGLMASFIITCLLLFLNLPLIYFFIKETKGINLSEVK